MTSLKAKLARYINWCDFLAKPYEFKVNHKKRNSTFIGGVLSFSIIVIGTLYFASILLKKIDKSNIIYNGTQSLLGEDFQLNNKTVGFFFGLSLINSN